MHIRSFKFQFESVRAYIIMIVNQLILLKCIEIGNDILLKGFEIFSRKNKEYKRIKEIKLKESFIRIK